MAAMVRYAKKRGVIAVGVALSLIVFFWLGQTPVASNDNEQATTSEGVAVVGKGKPEVGALTETAHDHQSAAVDSILYSSDYSYPITDPKKKENAIIVVLVRNREKDQLVEVLKTFENRFNAKYKYPYMMLNDEPFSDDFKAAMQSVISHADVTYTLVPPELWNAPSFTNMTYAREQMKKMAEAKVMYGGSESYRKMCRFYSGTIFQLKELQKYDYLWRLDSAGVKFHCDLDFDPFVMFREQGLLYGFTIGLHEYSNTIPTLWATVMDFMNEHSNIVQGSWMNFFTDDGVTYNGHHFWSNFEILDLNFFRGKEYQTFFNYLDQSGGFFYERWGDAVIHSLGVGLFADKSKVRWMEEIGYSHNPFTYCPLRAETAQKCDCHTGNIVNDIAFSCVIDFTRTPPKTIPMQKEIFVKASAKLWSVVSEVDAECDYELEIDDSGKYRTCKETPFQVLSENRRTEKCLVYSFGTKGSGRGLTSSDKTFVDSNCEVHVFNPHLDVPSLGAVVGELHKEKHYGIAFHQILLAPSGGKASVRDPSSHLHYTEMSLMGVRKMLHHEAYVIDVLKIDLEGDEWEVLGDFVRNPEQLSGVKYIMVELHLRQGQIWRSGLELPEIIEGVKKLGYETISCSQNPHSNQENLGDGKHPCCHKLTLRRTVR